MQVMEEVGSNGRPAAAVAEEWTPSNELAFVRAVTALIMNFTPTTETVKKGDGEVVLLRNQSLNHLRTQALLALADQLPEGARNRLRAQVVFAEEIQPYKRDRRRPELLPWESGKGSRGSSSR
jgi:hypothetical protein